MMVDHLNNQQNKEHAIKLPSEKFVVIGSDSEAGILNCRLCGGRVYHFQHGYHCSICGAKNEKDALLPIEKPGTIVDQFVNNNQDIITVIPNKDPFASEDPFESLPRYLLEPLTSPKIGNRKTTIYLPGINQELFKEEN